MCEKCKLRKRYKWFSLFCLICLSNVQVDRDKLIGTPCKPIPKLGK
jgi:hypothetical protein